VFEVQHSEALQVAMHLALEGQDQLMVPVIHLQAPLQMQASAALQHKGLFFLFSEALGILCELFSCRSILLKVRYSISLCISIVSFSKYMFSLQNTCSAV